MDFNDRSTPLSLLSTRRSARPRDLVGPGPDARELERILTIAARTPDHGRLFPWRFVTVGPEQREALAELFRSALAEEEPEAPPAKFAKAEDLATTAGQLVLLISTPVVGHKIPEWEQELSCGAAGMNLLHAAHALGFVGAWITGWQAYSPIVRSAFCGAHERIAGFFFIGDLATPLEERPRASLEAVSKPWTGAPEA